MSLILTLKITAIKTKDTELIKLLKKVDNYQELKHCRIATEVVDGDVLVYDASNKNFLIRIPKQYTHMNEAI